VDRGKPSGAFVLLANKVGRRKIMQVDLSPDNERNNAENLSFPEVIEAPVSWGKLNLQQAKNYKAIVNPKTGKVFSIVSKDYKMIRHEKAVQRIESVINKHPDLSKYRTDTEFYNHGGRMRRIYRFYEIPVEIKPGDTINPELQLFNSYDTSWPFIVLLGAFRVVCSNGLVIGEKYLHLRKRHVYDFDQMDIKKQVATALKRIKIQTNHWKNWAELSLTEKIYADAIKDMKFGKNAMKEIEDRTAQEAENFTDYGFPIMSLWIFFNILTWHITHRAISLNHRVEMERRLRSAIRHFK
jgi:hypothetical protein